MTDIDAREAAEALSDISDIARRVRQSRTYDIASQMIILWGVLVLAGNLANDGWPRQGGTIWIGANLLGLVGSLASPSASRAEKADKGLDSASWLPS
jgi:hypothetical protein